MQLSHVLERRQKKANSIFHIYACILFINAFGVNNITCKVPIPSWLEVIPIESQQHNRKKQT